MKLSYYNIVVMILLLNGFHCLRMPKVIPGVPSIINYDKQFIEDVVFQVRRNGRKSEYVANLGLTIKAYAGNNVTLHYVFFEYLHNEYRRSFVELHFKLCDLINKDALIGDLTRKAGLDTCPIKPGRYELKNMTFDGEFPSVFPFEKGKMEVSVFAEPYQRTVLKIDITLTFKQRVTR